MPYFSWGLLHLIVYSYDLKGCYLCISSVSEHASQAENARQREDHIARWYKWQTFPLVSDVHKILQQLTCILSWTEVLALACWETIKAQDSCFTVLRARTFKGMCFGDAHAKTKVFFMKCWRCSSLQGENWHWSLQGENWHWSQTIFGDPGQIISAHERIYERKKTPSLRGTSFNVLKAQHSALHSKSFCNL